MIFFEIIWTVKDIIKFKELTKHLKIAPVILTTYTRHRVKTVLR